MSDLSEVYAELRRILLPYARRLDCKADDGVTLHVDTRHLQKNRRALFFGAVRMGKNYVSYHLMPVYVHPELMKTASPALRKHMHGKSCFNFACVDAGLFRELAALTEAGFRDYEKRGYV